MGLAAIASHHAGQALTSRPAPADHTIRIAPVSPEIAPGKIIKTTGYNGAVPGPVGMGVVIEYAGQGSAPRWIASPKAAWDYTAFGRSGLASTPDAAIRLKFEKIPGGRGGYNRWTMNGKSWPDTNPLLTVVRGKRYGLVMDSNSGDSHPVHLHRHIFAVTKVGDKTSSGVMKDTISMSRYTTAEIEFVADGPGDTFFHCHHQDHMDEGFAGLITYG